MKILYSRYTPVKLPPSDAELLDQLTSQFNISRSEALRRGLRAYSEIAFPEKQKQKTPAA